MPTDTAIVLLADSAHVARTAGALLIPIVGLVLLVVGLMVRSRSPQSPPMGSAPGYPPPPGWGPPQTSVPQGFSPQPGPPGYAPPPRQKKRGTGLIIAGAVILAMSLIGGVARVASSDSSFRSSNSCVGSSKTESGQRTESRRLRTRQRFRHVQWSEADGLQRPERDHGGGLGGRHERPLPRRQGHADTDYTTLFWDDATICFAALNRSPS